MLIWRILINLFIQKIKTIINFETFLLACFMDFKCQIFISSDLYNLDNLAGILSVLRSQYEEIWNKFVQVKISNLFFFKMRSVQFHSEQMQNVLKFSCLFVFEFGCWFSLCVSFIEKKRRGEEEQEEGNSPAYFGSLLFLPLLA